MKNKMKKQIKKYLLITFAIATTFCLFNVAEASVNGVDPSAANFISITGSSTAGKVKLQTGTPYFNMPILSVPVRGLPDLTLNLAYNGEIIKNIEFVNEPYKNRDHKTEIIRTESSLVGFGWDIPLPSIVRSVRDVADFWQSDGIYSDKMNGYPFIDENDRCEDDRIDRYFITFPDGRGEELYYDLQASYERGFVNASFQVTLVNQASI